MCDDTEKGPSGVTVVAFLCVHAHRREASIVIEPLGPVGLVVDVVCHFLEVLEVGPEGQRVRRERGVIRGGEEETDPHLRSTHHSHGLGPMTGTQAREPVIIFLRPLLLHDGTWNGGQRALSERPGDGGSRSEWMAS